MYQNYGGYPPYPPFTPVFIPPQGGSSQPGLTLDSIVQQISMWKAVEKQFKEAPKDDKKKPEGPNVISMMLLMILLSPITGPIMSKFFSTGLSYLPH